MKTFIIGIAGGSGSGKTTLTRKILDQFDSTQILHITHDSYYRDISSYGTCDQAAINFDHPDALETSLLISQLKDLREGKSIRQPQYDFVTHKRKSAAITITPRPVIIVEGILLFADSELRALCDLKVYVETGERERLNRRLNRDSLERGRSVDSILAQFESTVKPMHDQFVEPSKIWANIVLSGNEDTGNGISIILEIVRNVVKNQDC